MIGALLAFSLRFPWGGCHVLHGPHENVPIVHEDALKREIIMVMIMIENGIFQTGVFLACVSGAASLDEWAR